MIIISLRFTVIFSILLKAFYLRFFGMCKSKNGQLRLIIIFIIFFVNFQKSMAKDKHGVFLNHFKFSHMYSFASHTVCPSPSMYITGGRVRLSNHLNQSLPMVTALEIMCSDGIRTKMGGEHTMAIDANIGDWTEVKECSNGLFATDVIFHLQALHSFGLIADDFSDPFRPYIYSYNYNRIIDVRTLLRNRFIAGITFNCSYRGKVSIDDYDDEVKGLKGVGNNAYSQAATLGRSTSFGLRVACLQDRVITGVYVVDEAILSYKEGERKIPIKLTVRCEEIFNPAIACKPELNWEQIESNQLKCTDAKSGQDLQSSIIADGNRPESVKCTITHSVGPSLNNDITNLKRILDAFRPTGLEDNIGIIMIPKLLSSAFRSDWAEKYKLPSSDYDKIVENDVFGKYLEFSKRTSTVQFENLKYDFIGGSRSKGIVGKDKLQHELKVFQLVAYCNVYKLYFPYFKNELQNFIEINVDGIKTDIVFEQM